MQLSTTFLLMASLSPLAESAQPFHPQVDSAHNDNSPAPTCSLPGIVSSITVNGLRNQLSDCRNKAVGMVGMSRINAAELPPPGEMLRLKAAVAAPATVQRSYDLELFFNHGETYLPDVGFEQLDQFVRMLSLRASKIISITLIGKGDVMEGALRFPANAGLQRAKHVLKYLRAAGFSESISSTIFQTSMESKGVSVKESRSVLVKVLAIDATDAISEPSTSASNNGRRPGDIIYAAAVTNLDIAIKDSDRIKSEAELPLRTESEKKDEVVRQEIARLKTALRERLEKNLLLEKAKTAGRLMVDIDSHGVVQQAWVTQFDGPSKFAQEAMELALSTSSLGPLPEQMYSTARRIVLSVGWSSDGPPKPGIVRAEGDVRPVYPLDAKKLGQEGVVMVRVQVLPDGRSGLVEIASSSGAPLLDDAAIDAVRRTYFFPTQKSEPVYQTMRMAFVLQ